MTSSPKIAVRWARAAEAVLPTESIVGFEIGNEGDIYSPASWRKTTQGVGTVLPARLTATSYADLYRSYAKALARIDRGVPLFGPALSDPVGHLGWIRRLLAGPHPGLRAVTVHRYPLSACSHRGQQTFPTIARVLSENATAGMAKSIRGARRAGLPVRLTEINSVTCGGRRGVSNTFATSLWAPDALFELLKAGATSAAVHVRANAINMAFSLTRHGLIAHPLLYGLIIFSRTLGPHPQLVPFHLHADPSLRLKAWAVRSSPTTLHILLINQGRRTDRVSLHVAGAGPAGAQQMLAPSARAESGVTLGGQRLDARGHWVGRPSDVSIPLSRGAYAVTVRGQSATLVTVNVSPGPLRP